MHAKSSGTLSLLNQRKQRMNQNPLGAVRDNLASDHAGLAPNLFVTGDPCHMLWKQCGFSSGAKSFATSTVEFLCCGDSCINLTPFQSRSFIKTR